MARVRRAVARPDAPELATDVVDLAQDGRGIARPEAAGGKVTFIKGALPGERVRYRLARRGKQADEGELSGIEQASPERVEPRCKHFGICGGCSVQHLSAAGQVAFKQKQLLDALERLGKVHPEQVARAITGPAWGYRRRARLSVKHVAKKGGVLVGFREADSPFVAQLESCVVLDPRVGLKLREIAACVGRLDIHTRVPQIEVAAADTVTLVFRVMQAPTEADRAVLRELGRAHGFEIHLQTGGYDTIQPLDPPATALTISPDGSDLKLAFRPTDFIQINDSVNQQMVRQALDWLSGNSREAGPALAPGGPPQSRFGQTPLRGQHVLELFCGLGNFSLPLARAGAAVTAVEGELGLVARARENARANGLDIRFEQADLFTPDPRVDWLRAKYDAALVDPPRAGAKEVLPSVADAAPERIVYVSCHPGTLARDADFLVHQRGYRLARAGILDMFPHTSHVESMALFERA
ncbi:MAG: methyltransferase domain-containing protein [Nevskiaceae bacterium]